jgi:hypothetical protein
MLGGFQEDEGAVESRVSRASEGQDLQGEIGELGVLA